VAVKVLPAHFLQDRTFLDRFTREAQVVAQLQHLHILPVYDFGDQDGVPYIVMAYMQGGTLADRITRGPMALDEVIRVVRQSAGGLDYAHQNGIIHRDFKPSNVLLDEQGNVQLADFGIAKVSEATIQLTKSGIAVGTPAYMAPEMYHGRELTPAVDVYALGVTLFQMLTGRLPFKAAAPPHFMMLHLNEPVPDARTLRPNLPEGVPPVIERAMAKSPEARYPSAGALAEALAQTASETDVEAPPMEMEPVMLAPSDAVTVDVMPEEETTPVSAPTPRGAEGHPVTAAPAPARSGINPLWIGGGVAAMAVLVGILALAGVFGGGQPPAEEDPSADVEPTAAEDAEEEAEPEVAQTQEPTSTPLPTETPVPLGFPGNPVTSNDQWTAVIEEFDGMEMALVPVGCFMMGDNGEGGEQCFDEPFWIDAYEVTNAQYGSSGSFSGDDHPRESVTWFAAVAHCKSRGARLPTEAEWEYAARGPDGLGYPWGNGLVIGTVVDGYNSGGAPAEVGSRPGGVSWVGAHDMSGNVWEWVSSIYSDYPYDATDGREASGSAESSSQRVLRGGSWGDSGDSIRAASRLWHDPYATSYYLGFRCTRSF
jgi:serine/threonine-protein kinase